MIDISFLKICFSKLSFKKLVPRAIEFPDIAPATYLIILLLILLSNTTEVLQELTFLGLILFKVRFAAFLPISSGALRSS